ncbi:uncharacterized protein LOC105689907 isoform X2 [Athalia rosae]|uniref:uncharacterized protein LOC105689907 isoform X2 n=1 Tax=Athalia rosae TaxID=37344 RepID=UPI0020338391|nr:uncharacterized protein LOC105689907 isoform X2 [Athalia rosae]
MSNPGVLDLTEYRINNEDPLGLTNQTAILICGMGAKELLPKMRDKNISTEVLADLTIDDLKLLGATPELADHMSKQISPLAKRLRRPTITSQKRLDELSNALVNSNKHLALLHAFIAYARLRMEKASIDSFIERDQNLYSSQALEMAIEATICEIHDARSALKNLELFLMGETTSKSPARYAQFAAFSTVALIACLVLKKSSSFITAK